MTQQLSLFPNSPLNPPNRLQAKTIAELDAALGPVDEMFAASTRFRNSQTFMKLLDFIAGFPNYSAFNGLLLYIQDPSATFVATARVWAKRFGRQLSQNAHPLVILAPMAPIRFVFDIRGTEGAPIPSEVLKSVEIENQLSGKIYSNTQHNCTFQGIAVSETTMSHTAEGTVDRITPALRKQYKDLNFQKKYQLFDPSEQDA